MSGVIELTGLEQDALATCEATIERGLKTFVKVGNALVQIRDERLYRAEFATFEKYCEHRWQLSGARAYQLMDGAKVHKLISSTNVEEINSTAASLPLNEAQVRPLTKLLPEPTAPQAEREQAQQRVRDTWTEALATAPRNPGGEPKVTAKHVEETVARTEPEPVKSATERKPTNRRPITDAFRDATWDLIKAVERIERLALDDRFPRNAQQVALITRGDLLRAADLLTAVIDRIPTSSKEDTKCQ